MRNLNGHTSHVRGVSFLPDGRIISVSADKTARVWDARGDESKIIHKGKGPLYALAVSNDGKFVALGGRSGTVDNLTHVYETVSWQPVVNFSWEISEIVESYTSEGLVGSFENVTRAIRSASFSHDGRFVAIAGRKPGAANIPNGGGGYCFSLNKHDFGHSIERRDAYAVRFAPNRNVLAVTVKGGVYIYQGFSLEIEKRFVEVSCDWAPAVEFIPGSNLVMIAAGGHFYSVDLESNSKPQKIKTGMRIVTAMAASPDGRNLLVAGKPGQVEVWDLSGDHPMRRITYDFEIGGVFGLAMAPDAMTFALAGEKGLALCDLEF